MDLTLLRRQNPAAFTELVAHHQATVLGLAQSLGLRGPDLDDAASEAFAAVYLALPRFEARSELSTWVYSIAYRTILKLREKRKRNETNAPLTEPADLSQPSPLEDAEQSDTAQTIWAAVESLEPRQASAVEMFYRRDWPIEKIAAVMQCPLGTVKTLLFRARAQLREILTRQEVYP